MGVKLTWHGHATWLLESGNSKILVDPFFDENPSAMVKANQVECNIILITHGHFDHVADTISIANRTGSQTVAVFEIAEWLGSKGVKNVTGMNLGGRLKFPFGWIKMIPALHSSTLPDGSNGGVPAGYLIAIDDRKFYFAGDTGLFSDMKLVGDMGIDVAVLPIGDLYTMGVDDSVTATQFINPKFVLPSHYNTWPPIQQNVRDWSQKISTQTSATPIVLRPGETHEFA